jgi:[protein-PII] uridylyltransferase
VRALDDWLAGLLADAVAGTPPGRARRGAPPPRRGAEGLALVAVGSLGRQEPPPYGDLDLVLVHDGRPEIAAVADALWYPIWDAGLRLDHSVRSVAEAVAVAGADVKAGLGLLDARLVAGDAEVAGRLRSATLAGWRQSAARLLPQLRDLRRARARQVGELAFLLEPDLKEAYGGLREGQVLRAVAAAQLADEPGKDTEEAYALLLDVRDELRRRAGRATDVLVHQERRAVAAALGRADEDALLREISLAGRRLAFVADETWRRVDAALVRRPRLSRRVRREPLAEGIVRQGDEVVLAQGAKPATDAGLLLRGAAAAAAAGLPLSPYTLKVLAAHAPPVPEPWPAELRWSFLRLLAGGRSAVAVLEQLDQAGLLARLLPEWDRVRSLPQHHPWHRFTVDRHLVETAAAAAELTHDVDRPDLLLIGALLHDIGKGCPGDHSEAGEPVAAAIATRMGFPPGDVAVIATLVRHHLLLPTTATRRDIDDPATVRRVGDTIGRDPAVLELLHALAQADGAATSSSAWSPWKAHLVAALVARVQALVAPTHAGQPEPVLHPSRPQVTSPVQGTGGAVEVGVAEVADGQQITVTAPDRPGLLSCCAGVLALNQLDVRAAKVGVEGERATAVFAVRPRFGRAPVAEILADGVRAALEGTLPLAERLRQREVDYRQQGALAVPARLSWHDGEAPGAGTGIVEVRAGDRAGLLYRLTAALAEEGLDATSARVETLGGDAVDSFYVCNPSGAPIDDDQRRRVDAALAAATGAGHEATVEGKRDTPG